MFKLALFTQALLAAAAFALPSASERAQRRREGRQGKPVSNLVSDSTQVQYSSNWAGVVLSAPAGTWKSVTGTFTVPSPKEPSGGQSTTEYSASAWVGIDGFTCTTAILQTGVDFNVVNGQVSYDAWYEWYPDYAYDFSGMTVAAGDTIKLTVTASNTKTGTAVIQNLSTNKSVTKALTSTVPLCEEDAEWIVEDYEDGSSLVPFANFGTVTFTNAVATTNNGTTVSPNGGTIVDIKQGSTVYTSVSATSNSVAINYV